MSRWEVLGVSWGENEPRLRVRIDGTSGSTFVNLRSLALGYEATSSRVCLGHNAFDGVPANPTVLVAIQGAWRYVDCANKPGRQPRCERCTTVENVLAASMHQAHNLGRSYVDRRHTVHLDQPHRLYLAGFRDGSVKVGTTAGATGGLRLDEQGAWRAIYVALSPDGYKVRDLEDAVTEQLGVAQAVSTTRKLRGIVTPTSTDELVTTLDDLSVRVHTLIAGSDAGDDGEAPSESAGAPLDPEPLTRRWANPAVDDQRWDHVLSYPNRLDRGRHRFEIVDVVGSVALLERNGSPDRFVFDLNQLRGLVLEVGDIEPDVVEVQASLF